VVVIQPNVDPYAEKFDPAMFEQNLEKIIQLTLNNIDAQTDYAVWPETSIQDGILINELSEEKTMQRIRNAFKSYPKLKIVCGINSYATYKTPKTRTSRYSKSGQFYWDAFNTAIQIDSSSNIPYYHKSEAGTWRGADALPGNFQVR
jgi:apolipoprotein N-acyltransferase